MHPLYEERWSKERKNFYRQGGSNKVEGELEGYSQSSAPGTSGTSGTSGNRTLSAGLWEYLNRYSQADKIWGYDDNNRNSQHNRKASQNNYLVSNWRVSNYLLSKWRVRFWAGCFEIWGWANVRVGNSRTTGNITHSFFIRMMFFFRPSLSVLSFFAKMSLEYSSHILHKYFSWMQYKSWYSYR